jgi:hypothetical protein
MQKMQKTPNTEPSPGNYCISCNFCTPEIQAGTMTAFPTAFASAYAPADANADAIANARATAIANAVANVNISNLKRGEVKC